MAFIFKENECIDKLNGLKQLSAENSNLLHTDNKITGEG